MFKKVVKALVPPIFPWLYHKIRLYFESPDKLFDGDDGLFKKALEDTRLYGEYGCGKSTKWVLNNINVNVIAVDTSKLWIDEVLVNNQQNKVRLTIEHVDLGELGHWGRPTDYSRSQSFVDYTDWMWKQPEKPDTVLVDGRFRVCCFLTCLKYADEGTRIIFDDYTIRPYYHFVEKYVSRAEECGRQCLFIVPPRDKINLNDLEKDIVSFRYVME